MAWKRHEDLNELDVDKGGMSKGDRFRRWLELSICMYAMKSRIDHAWHEYYNAFSLDVPSLMRLGKKVKR
jgi:hypothetical protein